MAVTRMRKTPCGSARDHAPHTWRPTRRWARRRQCLGLVTAPCGLKQWHAPHWTGEHRDELCRGVGLIGICEHGVQALSGCTDCDAAPDATGRLPKCPCGLTGPASAPKIVDPEPSCPHHGALVVRPQPAPGGAA